MINLLTIAIDEHENPTIFSLTPKILPIFTAILSDPAEQLDVDTRHRVVSTVKFIAERSPDLIHGNEVLSNSIRSWRN